jgi:hypothetical protein
LTGLTLPIYFTKEVELYPTKFSSLNIKDRTGKAHELELEPDELAIQCSDAIFILS